MPDSQNPGRRDDTKTIANMENVAKQVADDADNQKPPEYCKGAANIMRSAEFLFAEQGYAAVSILSIAKRAGVCPANVIYHFRTKRRLYLAVLRASRERISAVIENLDSDEDNLPEYLSEYARAHLKTLLGDDRGARLLLREIMGYGPIESKELVEKVMGGGFARLVNILRRGKQRGAIGKGVDPAVAALLMMGANGLFLQTRKALAHMQGADFDDNADEFTGKVMDILLYGIMTEKGGGK